MDSVNTQNGISASTNDTLRIQSEGTSFPTAISKVFIGAAYSPREAEPLSTDITTLKTQQRG